MNTKQGSGFWATIGFVTVVPLVGILALGSLILIYAAMQVISAVFIVWLFAPIVIPYIWWVVGSAWANGTLDELNLVLTGWPLMPFGWMGLWVFPVGILILAIWIFVFKDMN
jgi:hypothetical protein